jgi:hypothetical protein
MLGQHSTDRPHGFDVRHVLACAGHGQDPNELPISINDSAATRTAVTVEVDHDQSIGIGLHDSSPSHTEIHHALVGNQPKGLLNLMPQHRKGEEGRGVRASA